jgi:hypothetical protein
MTRNHDTDATPLGPTRRTLLRELAAAAGLIGLADAGRAAAVADDEPP